MALVAFQRILVIPTLMSNYRIPATGSTSDHKTFRWRSISEVLYHLHCHSSGYRLDYVHLSSGRGETKNNTASISTRRVGIFDSFTSVAYRTSRKLRNAVENIRLAIWDLPQPIRRVCYVQLFAFMGWFPFLFYSYGIVSRYRSRTNASPGQRTWAKSWLTS